MSKRRVRTLKPLGRRPEALSPIEERFINGLASVMPGGRPDRQRLRTALEVAQADHDYAMRIERSIEQNHPRYRAQLSKAKVALRDSRQHLAGVSRNLREVRRLFGLGEAKADLLFFSGVDEEALDSLDRDLEAASRILERQAKLVEQHGNRFRRPRGNPGRSRSAAISLWPLYELARSLAPFWKSQTGLELGQAFEKQFESTEELAPENAASKFFVKVAQYLNPDYTAANCRQALKKLGSMRRKSFA